MKRVISTSLAVALIAAVLASGPGTAGYIPTSLVGLLARAQTWTTQQVFSLNTSGAASNASAPLIVVGTDGTAAPLPIFGFGALAYISLSRADGTAAAPTAVQNNETLGAIYVKGYYGSGYSPNVGVACSAAENFSSTAQGTMCRGTATVGGTTTAATAFTWTGAWFQANLPLRVTSATVTASGTGLTSATALTQDINVITGGTGGVSLAPYNVALGGVQRQEIVNVSGATQNVYGSSTSVAIWNLNGSTSSLAAGAAMPLSNGTHGLFACYSTSQCYGAP